MMDRNNLIVAGVFASLMWLAAGTARGQASDIGSTVEAHSEQSVARQWNEALLYAIRRDFARPTVHARNLFHASAAMYDSWAIYDTAASPVFLGRQQANGFECALGSQTRQQLRALGSPHVARSATLAVAVHRLLSHRFSNSPGVDETIPHFDQLLTRQLNALGLAGDYLTRPPYDLANPVHLGSHLGACLIAYGLADGSNEQGGYANRFYQPVNAALDPTKDGNASLLNPDRWQPLMLSTFIDQSGNMTDEPIFLSAEWGNVEPFSLTDQDVTRHLRDDHEYTLYLDPGAPATLADGSSTSADYLWGHAMVAAWSAHLDPDDGVMIDISPASMGNADVLPTDIAGLRNFFHWQQGGTSASGHALNPITGRAYAPNRVPRGDYTRVLAEFWADGPDSETPPGHWFAILNEKVLDHTAFERRFEGVGDALDALEFEVRAYLLLGAAMHDAAIVAWSAKGWYDSARPISALRYMAGNGQSSNPGAASYHSHGIPLQDGLIELVEAGDPLAGNGGIHIGKIKVRAWRGPAFIVNPNTDKAGVGWILLEKWWPYQRPTFVTPPFAGYVSGHSTFSRAAAEVLTRLTGSAFFPGGIAEFTAEKNDFLVFEKGPSVDVVLQWATYRDASDQTSLSRIWGGIHPPVDDIPGRRLGIEVANRVFDRAMDFFAGNTNNINTTTDGELNDADNAVSNLMRSGGCSIGSAGQGSSQTPDWGMSMLLVFGFFWRFFSQPLLSAARHSRPSVAPTETVCT